MRPPSARPLCADVLFDFHAGRASLYEVAYELLRAPPRAAGLRRARERLAASRRSWCAPAPLLWLEEAGSAASSRRASDEHSRLFAATGPALPGRWPDPGAEIRVQAYAAAAVLPLEEERVSELKVLSELAGRTTEALAAASLPEASILVDVQSRVLVHHAGSCLGDWVTRLRQAGGPLYSQVGTALAWCIEEDLRLLGYPDEPP